MHAAAAAGRGDGGERQGGGRGSQPAAPWPEPPSLGPSSLSIPTRALALSPCPGLTQSLKSQGGVQSQGMSLLLGWIKLLTCPSPPDRPHGFSWGSIPKSLLHANPCPPLRSHLEPCSPSTLGPFLQFFDYIKLFPTPGRLPMPFPLPKCFLIYPGELPRPHLSPLAALPASGPLDLLASDQSRSYPLLP